MEQYTRTARNKTTGGVIGAAGGNTMSSPKAD